MSRGESVKTLRAVRTVFTETGAVLQNTNDGTIFSINLAGSKIWRQLTQGTTRDEIVDQLSVQFGVSRDQVSCDVDEFLRRLEQKGLLQKEPS